MIPLLVLLSDRRVYQRHRSIFDALRQFTRPWFGSNFGQCHRTATSVVVVGLYV